MLFLGHVTRATNLFMLYALAVAVYDFFDFLDFVSSWRWLCCCHSNCDVFVTNACLVLAFALYLMDVGVSSIYFRRYLLKYALQHHLLLRFMSLSPLSFQFYSFYWICVFNCSLSWQVVWHQTLFSGWRDVGNLIKGICQL